MTVTEPASLGSIDLDADLAARAIIAAARGRQRKRRRRRLLAAMAALFVLVGGIQLARVAGRRHLRWGSPNPPSTGNWHPAGTAVWYYGIPGNNPIAPDTTSVSCAGSGVPECYVVLHANAIGLNGHLIDPRVALGFGPDDTSLLRSSDGGRTWTRLPVPDTTWLTTALSCPTASTCAVGAIVDQNPADGYGSTGTAAVLFTTDAGRTWQTRLLPRGDGQILGLSCPGAADCVAISVVKGAPDIGGPNGAISFFYRTNVLVTANAGRTWSTSAFPVQPRRSYYWLRSVTCPDVARCYFTGASTGVTYDRALHGDATVGETDVLMVSRDDGRSLQLSSTLGPLWPTMVSCATATTCLAIAQSPTGWSLMRTTDAGRTWARIYARGLPADNLDGIVCQTGDRCLAYLTGPGDASGLASSTDGGRTWHNQPGTRLIGPISCTARSACIGLQTDTKPGPGTDPYAQAVRPVTNIDASS